MIALEQLRDNTPADRNFQKLATVTNAPLPQARVFNSTNITHTNAGLQALTFDSKRYDSGNLHGASSKLTAPITGLYEIGASVEWAANTTGYRGVLLRLNGSTLIASDLRMANGAGVVARNHVSTHYHLTAGDYIEVMTEQGSGGSLVINATGNYSPEFWMARLGGFTNEGVYG